MTGQTIEIAAEDGKSFSAYLATPKQGKGPGLILLQEIFGINGFMKETADRFAEGYVVVVPDLFWRMAPGTVLGYGEADFARALELNETRGWEKPSKTWARPSKRCGRCLNGSGRSVPSVIVLAGNLPCWPLRQRTSIALSAITALASRSFPERSAAESVVDGLPLRRERCIVATLRARHGHAALSENPLIEHYVYAGCDHAFATPEREHYNKPASIMKHSRTIAMLRKVLGPVYDLNTLWELHCYHEFDSRDVDAIMPTMIEAPYVNHIPTMTGGVGLRRAQALLQVSLHSVPNPADTRFIPISRTIGRRSCRR